MKKISKNKTLLILLFFVVLMAIPSISANDGIDLIDNENNIIKESDLDDEKVIYMGTEEMEFPDPNELNNYYFTDEMLEKEIYDYDDNQFDLNRSINSNNNFKIVFNSHNIHQTSKLTVHLETLGSNELIQLPASTPFHFTINGRSYTRYTDSNGVCSININLLPSSYPVKVIFNGNNQYSAKSVTQNINVYAKNVVLTPITSHVQQYTQFLIKLTDNDKVPIANKVVDFNINGNDYPRTTNASGVAKLNINLDPRTYQLTYSFPAQNGYYESTQKSLNLIVKNVVATNTKLTSQSTFVQRTSNYNVRLTTASGVALSNQQVIITVNGVPYYRTTNANGVVGLQINLNRGTYAIVVNYAGTSSYSCSSLYQLIHTSDSSYNNINTFSDLTIYRTAISPRCNYSQSYIQTLSSTITSGCTGDLEKTIALYNYVHNFGKDVYGNTKYGDLKAILVNHGNCLDHIHAFISLARARGLAVRYVIGWNNLNEMGHAWAQVCIDNEWIVADPSNTQKFGEYGSSSYLNMIYQELYDW